MPEKLLTGTLSIQKTKSCELANSLWFEPLSILLFYVYEQRCTVSPESMLLSYAICMAQIFIFYNLNR